MAGGKEINYQQEAYYTMKSINFMYRNALKTIKEVIDRAGKPELEILEDVRKVASTYVPDKIEE